MYSLELSGPLWRVSGTVQGTDLGGTATFTYEGTDFSGVIDAQEQHGSFRSISTFSGLGSSEGARFVAGLGVRGDFVFGLVEQPDTARFHIVDVNRLIAFIGSFSPEDSSVIVTGFFARPPSSPLGVGRMRSDGHTTWVEMVFAFGPGSTGHWRGDFPPPPPPFGAVTGPSAAR